MRITKQRKQMDNYQCQICGDRKGKKYDTGTVVEKVEAHHIIPRFEGGETTLDNLITLCDMCHAVLTEHNKWREYFGDKGVSANMKWIKAEFDNYIKSKNRSLK